jgi:rhamnosyl/mannosyltransferase
MRILQIGKFYPPQMGGIETHLQTLCQELRDEVEIQVVVANDGRSRVTSNVDGVTVARMGRLFTLASTPVCIGMAREIRRSKTDIVHLHMPNPVGALAYLRSRHSGRLVVTWHSDVVRQQLLAKILYPIEQAILQSATAVVVTSKNYLSSSRPLRAHRSKCRVIPYGIPLEKFDGAEDPRVKEIRRRYGPKIVLAVGRLVYYKGFEYLIRAMSRVQAVLVLIGDGPLRRPLEGEVAALGIRDQVAFLGELQNETIAPYYQGSDVFVLPSIARSEAFGIVQIEAMASSKPVVNTALDSGVPAVSLHGLTGITVPPGNSDALAEAINTLLKNSRLCALYGRSAQQRAHKEFSSGAMGQSVLQLYREVLGRTGSADTSARPEFVDSDALNAGSRAANSSAR